MHRVVDIGKERWSCPFFLDPCFDAVIPPNIFKDKKVAKKDKIAFGVQLTVRMRNKYVEWKGLKLPGEEGYVTKSI